MRFKRTGFLTKIVVLCLLIYMATALLDLRGQIQLAQQQKDEMEQRAAELRAENRQMSGAIENSGDPEVLEQAAREKGYVKEREILYRDVAR